MKYFKVGLIGGGGDATPLLHQLLAAPFVQLVAICDTRFDPEVAEVARQHGVLLTHNGLEIAEMGAGVDVIIDMTGSPKVRGELRRIMQFSGNTHTVIVPYLAARLMLSLAKGELVEAVEV